MNIHPGKLKSPLLTFAAVIIAVAAPTPSATASEANTDTSPIPAEYRETERCEDLVETRPRVSPDMWPAEALNRELFAWVVLDYELDGSGQPVNIDIVASEPSGLFEQLALAILSQTTYEPGVVRSECRYVAHFESARRR